MTGLGAARRDHVRKQRIYLKGIHPMSPQTLRRKFRYTTEMIVCAIGGSFESERIRVW